MKTIRVDTTEIDRLIQGDNRGQFIGLLATTEQRMKKRGNPLRKHAVTKTTLWNGRVGCEYQSDDGSTGGNAWGEIVVDDSRWIVHKGKKYIRFQPQYRGKVIAYYVNGKPATKEQIELINKFRYKGSPKPPRMLRFKVTSIDEIRIAGKCIKVNK